MIETIRTPQDIGQAIRALRQQKDLTGIELGRQSGLSQSKISKIETGAIRPSSKEVKKVMDILECPEGLQQQIAAALDSDATIPSSEYRAALVSKYSVFKREAHATHLRFVAHLLPALLQTTAYYEAFITKLKKPEELTWYMRQITKRQDLLWDKKRSYHFLVSEGTLYVTPSTRDVQYAQLDRLDRLCGMQRIKLGIVPLEVGAPKLESAAFILYDNHQLVQLLLGRELLSEDPEDIAKHTKLFSELDKQAAYGQEAKDLIRKAMRFFTSQ